MRFTVRSFWNHLNGYVRIYPTLTDVNVGREPIPIKNGGWYSSKTVR